MILRRPFLLLMLLAPCQGLVSPLKNTIPRLETKQSKTALQRLGGSSNADSEDLFDFFDPLRSPHDYPDGIGPDSKPENDKRDNGNEEDLGSKMRMGLDLLASEFPVAFASPPPDLELADAPEEKVLDESQKKFSSSSTTSGGSSSTSSQTEQEAEKEYVDLFDVFDPTLSPHSYPNGIPSTKKEQQTKVGIILMDHGSRNKASNQRLHDLASLYQETMFRSASESNAVIVEAAHMEIAGPSIPEVLKALVEEGVDEIICHPYFLSPGRHVVEDIPEIVEGAIRDMDIQIPVITTNPVGSSTDLMINAIHALVEKSSTTIGTHQNSSPQRNRLGF